MASLERVKTGIPGFDELIQGGIPKGFNVLIAGLPGTGKTILGLQYLYNGAMAGENGVYVSLESGTDGIREQVKQFGMDLSSLEKQNKIAILNVPMNVVKLDLFKMIEDAVNRIGAKRLVFDSLDVFVINIDLFTIPISYVGSRNKTIYTGNSEKRITYLVINKLSMLGTTNMIITDARQGGDQLTVDGVSEFACDGVVHMHAVEGEDDLNTLNMVKFRLTKVRRGIYNFVFSPQGILIKT